MVKTSVPIAIENWKYATVTEAITSNVTVAYFRTPWSSLMCP